MPGNSSSTFELIELSITSSSGRRLLPSAPSLLEIAKRCLSIKFALESRTAAQNSASNFPIVVVVLAFDASSAALSIAAMRIGSGKSCLIAFHIPAGFER
ncbi:hypothetical protein D3C85_1103320 [compost metagenome]